MATTHYQASQKDSQKASQKDSQGIIGGYSFRYKPMEKQSEFHRSNAKYRFYFGGVGSGKTLCGAAEAITLSIEYPNNLGLVGRQTYPELDDTSWKELLEFPLIDSETKEEVRFIDSRWIANYNKQKRNITLINGSSIIGRAFDDSFDKLAKGLNLGWAWGDELTEAAKEVWFGIIKMRLRRKVVCKRCGQLPPERNVICPACKILTIRHTAFGTSNPEGHDWVWKEYVAKESKDVFYVTATSDENNFLSQDYLDGLGTMPEEWQKRYRYGSFETFEGLVYKEFNDTKPQVQKHFDLPTEWYHFISLDHGYRNPTGILWGAASPSGEVYVYDEFYGSGKRVSELSEIIKAKTGRQFIQGYLIDPSADSDRGYDSGKTIVDEFEDNGLYFQRANNEVSAGINHVAEYLKINNGKSKLIIFDNCINLRIELQAYRWKDIKMGTKTNAPEKPMKRDDHLCDGLRYLINHIYTTPIKKPELQGWKKFMAQRKESTFNWMTA